MSHGSGLQPGSVGSSQQSILIIRQNRECQMQTQIRVEGRGLAEQRQFLTWATACILMLVLAWPTARADDEVRDDEAATHSDEAATYQLVDERTNFTGFKIAQYDLAVLSHFSYMLYSGGECLVVDPGRDIDTYVEAAAEGERQDRRCLADPLACRLRGRSRRICRAFGRSASHQPKGQCRIRAHRVERERHDERGRCGGHVSGDAGAYARLACAAWSSNKSCAGQTAGPAHRRHALCRQCRSPRPAGRRHGRLDIGVDDV